LTGPYDPRTLHTKNINDGVDYDCKARCTLGMGGTLIDSEEFHWISWRETMASEGVGITREQFLSSFGQRNDSILPDGSAPQQT